MADPKTTLTVTGESKPWQKSLAMQGAMVAGGASLVLSYGPQLAHLAGVDAATAAELSQALAGFLSGVAGLMVAIGRLRLGGLH